LPIDSNLAVGGLQVTPGTSRPSSGERIAMNPQNVETHKEITIIVNGRERVVSEKELSFDQVVRLAFPNPHTEPEYVYTVTYFKGEDAKKEGALVKGQTVKVKEGLVINVIEPNRW